VIAEVVDDLSDKEDRTYRGSTADVEANAALESVTEHLTDLPIMDSACLHSKEPVICVAARTFLDEGAAIMLSQLLQKHGIPACVESVGPLPTQSGSPDMRSRVICLSCLDSTSLAHMRYIVRRCRRRLPNARIILCCWQADADKSVLSDSSKADVAVITLRDAVVKCIEFVQADIRAHADNPAAAA
jgi:hypothetical protein